MVKKLFLSGFALLLGLAACAPAGIPSSMATPNPSPFASPVEEPAAPREITIVYHRSGGFAGRDDTWKISTDGTVSHQGRTAGVPEQLTAEQWAELTTAVQ